MPGMKTLYFDTETSGLCNFRLPADHPSQPRCVQLACILALDDGRELACFKQLIAPDGFTIDPEAARVTGITTEFANENGLHASMAFNCFWSLYRLADECVAFNADFDKRIIYHECVRNQLEQLDFKKLRCAMLAMKDVCRIPSLKVAGDFKWPKLAEAYRHAFQKDFEGAHDALADVRATKDVWLWYKKTIASAQPPQAQTKAA